VRGERGRGGERAWLSGGSSPSPPVLEGAFSFLAGLEAAGGGVEGAPAPWQIFPVSSTSQLHTEKSMVRSGGGGGDALTKPNSKSSSIILPIPLPTPSSFCFPAETCLPDVTSNLMVSIFSAAFRQAFALNLLPCPAPASSSMATILALWVPGESLPGAAVLGVEAGALAGADLAGAEAAFVGVPALAMTLGVLDHRSRTACAQGT
jgi:hypothetical protein